MGHLRAIGLINVLFDPFRCSCWSRQPSQLLRSDWRWHGCSYRILGQFSQNLELTWRLNPSPPPIDTHTFSIEIWREQCCSLLLWNNISTLYLHGEVFLLADYCISRLSVNEIKTNTQKEGRSGRWEKSVTFLSRKKREGGTPICGEQS